MSFLSLPENGLLAWGKRYGEWLLSDAERARRFTRVHNGAVYWQSQPCALLLQAFEKLRGILCVWMIIPCGPSVRGTEISRQLLANMSGAAVRNVMILYRCFCIVGIQDKSSSRTLRKRFTPHTPTKRMAKTFVHNLAIFRPFEHMLMKFFFGAVEAERYNIYLWPGAARNFDGDRISGLLGDATERSLLVRLQILDYRKIVSAFRRHFVELSF